MNAVIRFRTVWLADSTPFDACSVARWTGPAADLLRGLPNPERVLLGRAGEGCVRGRVSPAAQAALHVVVVDSVAASDSAATVLVFVRRGEYTHRETFSVVAHRVGATWGVREVRMWGAVQSSPPPRGRRTDLVRRPDHEHAEPAADQRSRRALSMGGGRDDEVWACWALGRPNGLRAP